jgi:hypothetical protein
VTNNIKRKRSFGSVSVDQFSSTPTSKTPANIDIKLNFRQALKLHLGLGRLLGHISLTETGEKPKGRQAVVKLSLNPAKNRITINKGSAGKRGEG